MGLLHTGDTAFPIANTVVRIGGIPTPGVIGVTGRDEVAGVRSSLDQGAALSQPPPGAWGLKGNGPGPHRPDQANREPRPQVRALGS